MWSHRPFTISYQISRIEIRKLLYTLLWPWNKCLLISGTQCEFGKRALFLRYIWCIKVYVQFSNESVAIPRPWPITIAFVCVCFHREFRSFLCNKCRNYYFIHLSGESAFAFQINEMHCIWICKTPFTIECTLSSSNVKQWLKHKFSVEKHFVWYLRNHGNSVAILCLLGNAIILHFISHSSTFEMKR